MPHTPIAAEAARFTAASLPIRRAEPEDSGFLAKAILHASRSHLPRGLWDLVFEGPEDDRLGFLELMTLLEERSFCHFGNFFVMEASGAPVAALSGFDPGEEGVIGPGYAIAIAGEQYGLTESELLQAYSRLETYQLGVPEQHKGVWTIEWVWTVPDMRRRGLVGLLIGHILQEGIRLQHARSQVTTFIGNTAAERAYEKFGFRVAEQRRNAEFERMMGAPGLSRYELSLADRPGATAHH